jgi:hypothetical protein
MNKKITRLKEAYVAPSAHVSEFVLRCLSASGQLQQMNAAGEDIYDEDF